MVELKDAKSMAIIWLATHEMFNGLRTGSQTHENELLTDINPFPFYSVFLSPRFQKLGIQGFCCTLLNNRKSQVNKYLIDHLLCMNFTVLISLFCSYVSQLFCVEIPRFDFRIKKVLGFIYMFHLKFLSFCFDLIIL